MTIEHRLTEAGVPFVRTPDEAFEGLPDYDFAPSYLTFEGLRLHYVDVGPRDGPVALLMHGMPTWSFLNRHIIHGLVTAGYRCIAADHIGFGRSDKVTDPDWYTIAKHTAAHRMLIEALDLRDVTLFVQDWGGPIGLAQAADMPERFSRLVIMNTWLHHDAFVYSPAIRNWQAGWSDGGVFRSHVPDRLTIGWFMMIPTGHMAARDLYGIVQGGAFPPLSAQAEAVRRGYDAPHSGMGDAAYNGPRQFPLSIPIDRPQIETALTQARHFKQLLGWSKPIHFIWGGKDGVFTEAWGREWAAHYPQASFDLIPEADHFLQETHGAEIVRIFRSRST